MVSPSIHTCMHNAVIASMGLAQAHPKYMHTWGQCNTCSTCLFDSVMLTHGKAKSCAQCVSGQEMVWWMKLNYLGLLSSMIHLALLLRQWNSVPVLEYLLDFVTNAFLIYITIVATAHASPGDFTWFTRPCEKVGSGHKSRWGCWSTVTALWYETVVS